MDPYEKHSISVREVTKEYGPAKGIFKINVMFESGRLNVLTGENGSGKSTLLKCIMGLISYQGRIVKRRVRIGYAPEEYIMPLHMTVMDFLYSIGRIKGMPGEELNDNVRYYLDYFELSEMKHKPLKLLSHGMRQKVNLMQAFIHQPKIIILDEPLTGLDHDMADKVVALIKSVSKTNIVLVSTHQPHRFSFRNRELFRFEEGILTLD